MAEDKQDDEARRREEEIARYRRAAEEALEQLEWCVNYLHRIRKSPIAEANTPTFAMKPAARSEESSDALSMSIEGVRAWLST